MCLAFFFFFFFFFLRTPCAAHGSSQARGQIRATAAGLHHSHQRQIWATSSTSHHSPWQRWTLNPWSEARIEATSSWLLIWFVTRSHNGNSKLAFFNWCMQYYISFRSTIQNDTFVHHGRVTTVSLVSICHWSYHSVTDYILYAVHDIPKTYLFSNWKLVPPLNLFHPTPLATTSLSSVSLRLFLFCCIYWFCFLDSTYKWNHAIFVFLCLACYFFLFLFFQLHPWDLEFPGPGIESELELRPAPQLQQCRILNPLHWAGDQTLISMETKQIINPLCHSRNSSARHALPSIAP